MNQKLLWIFLITLYFPINTFAQLNLVPNPSFEDSIYCPGLNSPNINYANHWRAYRGTPDYLHTCANAGPFYANGQPIYGVPQNIGGYQMAKHGNAYGGLFTWCCSNGANQREFMGTILTSYLTIGTQYYFSCYVSNGDSVESNAATNNLGMTLSTIPYNGTPGYTMALSNFSHLKIDTILNEKNSWVRWSGSIIADSAYRFLVLGNFHNDASTLVDSSTGPATLPLAYYYIDAVCLTTDSVYDAMWTTVNNFSEQAPLSIYPNPAQTNIVVENNHGSLSLKIIDFSGRPLLSIGLKIGRNEINIESLDNGIYFLQIDKYPTQKLLVIK